MNCFLLIFLLVIQPFVKILESGQDSNHQPIKLAVAGLTHDHVHGLFGFDNAQNDIEIVGIYEPNKELWDRYREMYDLDPTLYYDDLTEMLTETSPQAVSAFGSTYDHLELVQEAAPKGIHVMVEKPLAVSYNHALQMKKLADKHTIHLITNYETTWYSSNQEVKRLFDEEDGQFGEIRKVIVNDGHQGPKEIGVSDEFLEWLTDPKLNGGGALMDFGCYGANLITWLMDGKEPTSVTAVTQTQKPEIYPKVDDEATIILTYPGVQGIIQASWNWPYNRKDMEVYGVSGYAFALTNRNIRTLENTDTEPEQFALKSRNYPFNNPFSYFTAVIRGDITVEDTDLSSLSNNMTVMKILDAARQSATSGQTVELAH